MAPKKDLVGLAAKEALAEKSAGKRAGVGHRGEGHPTLRKGPSTPKVAPSVPVEKVREGLPNHSTMMTPPF